MPSQQWGSMQNMEGVITVPEIILPFEEDIILERLQTTVNPLGPKTNHDIDLFEEAVATVSGMCLKINVLCLSVSCLEIVLRALRLAEFIGDVTVLNACFQTTYTSHTLFHNILFLNKILTNIYGSLF